MRPTVRALKKIVSRQRSLISVLCCSSAMVVYGLAFGNQRHLNGGDFSTRTDELWPEAACTSCLSAWPNGPCGGGRDLSRDALGVADFRDAQIVGALEIQP
jgi:hypothetical protein